MVLPVILQGFSAILPPPSNPRVVPWFHCDVNKLRHSVLEVFNMLLKVMQFWYNQGMENSSCDVLEVLGLMVAGNRNPIQKGLNERGNFLAHIMEKFKSWPQT